MEVHGFVQDQSQSLRIKFHVISMAEQMAKAAQFIQSIVGSLVDHCRAHRHEVQTHALQELGMPTRRIVQGVLEDGGNVLEDILER